MGRTFRFTAMPGTRASRIVLAVYFDDSKDGGDVTRGIPAIQVMGGYVGFAAQWDCYEAAVVRPYDLFKVDVLHGMKLHKGAGCFKGWTPKKKAFFVGSLYTHLAKYALAGFALAVPIDHYLASKKRHRADHQISPLRFCFKALINQLFQHETIGPLIRQEGLSIYVETGNPNNGDIERMHHAFLKKYLEYEACVHQLAFVNKGKCKAIQVADFWVIGCLEHQWTLATDFYPPEKKR